MVNTCVCCGAIIPEGRQVCPICENSVRTGMSRRKVAFHGSTVRKCRTVIDKITSGKYQVTIDR